MMIVFHSLTSSKSFNLNAGYTHKRKRISLCQLKSYSKARAILDRNNRNSGTVVKHRHGALLQGLLVERVLVDSEAGTVAITFRPSGIRTLTKEKIA